MATSGQGIWNSLSDGSVRDYKHAAQIFRSNSYSRAPKSKFQFYVRIVLNPNAFSNGIPTIPEFRSELNYLVKTVDMPKFEMDIQEYNQYNRKALIQRQIRYSPVSIKFHDDNNGTLRTFWKAYYNYYFMDGRYDLQAHQLDDRYTDRKSARWGIDTGIKGSGLFGYPHFISHIEIYSMNKAKAQNIVIYNPIISNFSHDTHDYADNTGILEASIQFRYTGVGYINNVSAVRGIPGFGLDAPEAYDVELSDLTDGSGRQVDPKTGELYDPSLETTGDQLDDVLYQRWPFDPILLQQLAMTQINPGAPNYVSNQQLAAMLANLTGTVNNNSFSFPVGNPVVTQFQEYGAVPLAGSNLSSSDGQSVPSPASLANLYTDNSWQKSLYLKGYTPSQITAAERFISTAKFGQGTNIQEVAEQYLRNPLSNRLQNVAPVVFGQPTSRPTNLNFSNPLSTTQAIYNSNNWQNVLSSKGYTQAQINSAQRFLATVRVSPGTDLSAIAQNYLNRLSGSLNQTPTPRGSGRPVGVSRDTVYASGTPNFDESSYKPI